MQTTAPRKLTKATVKALVRKNQGRLLVKVLGSHDAWNDGWNTYDHEFQPAKPPKHEISNNCGIDGVWLVGGDLVKHYEDGKVIGLEVYNCCQHFIVAVAK